MYFNFLCMYLFFIYGMIVSFKREQGGFQTLRGYLQLASISIKLPYYFSTQYVELFTL